MPTYTVRLYGIGANPLRTEQLAAQDAGAAASWASAYKPDIHRRADL